MNNEILFKMELNIFDIGEIIDVNNIYYIFKVLYSFINLIVLSEISVFFFFYLRKLLIIKCFIEK